MHQRVFRATEGVGDAHAMALPASLAARQAKRVHYCCHLYLSILYSLAILDFKFLFDR